MRHWRFRHVMSGIALSLWLSGMVLGVDARVVVVAPDGDDSHAGTTAQPVRTLRRAAELVAGQAMAQEIVLKEGQHEVGDLYLGRTRQGELAPPVSLVIRAERNDDGTWKKVVINGGRAVDPAMVEAVVGMPGVFRFPTPSSHNARRHTPSMWETDRRVRYTLCGDERSVAAMPATFVFTDDWVYFHPSAEQPVAELGLRFGACEGGIYVTWPNVTIRRLEFRDYVNVVSSSAIMLMGDGPGQVVEDCRFFNCVRAVTVDERAIEARISRCIAEDVANGVFSYGRDALVEDCVFICRHDRFRIPLFDQTHSGVQYYSPAVAGRVRRTVCDGFNLGIFAKGVRGRFLVESNTVVSDLGEKGIGIQDWNQEASVVRHNIVMGYVEPITVRGFDLPQRGVIVDDNVLFDRDMIDKDREILGSIGTGMNNVHRDPGFVSVRRSDFRLLPTAPLATMRVADGKRGPVGACAVVADDWRDDEPPRLKLALTEPARTFKQPRVIADAGAEDEAAMADVQAVNASTVPSSLWITPERNVTLVLDAVESFSKATLLKVKEGDSDWSAPRPFQAQLPLRIPSGQARHIWHIQVADEAGNWSDAAGVMATLIGEAPALPALQLRVSEHGLLIRCTTVTPCVARLQFKHQPADNWITIADSRNRQAFTLAQAKDKDAPLREELRFEHHLLLRAADVKAPVGATVRYRLELDNGMGKTSLTPERTVRLTGEPTDIHVSVTGDDETGDGSVGRPYRSIGVAAETALPGDRVRVQPGVYTSTVELTHGGAPDRPIVIESVQPRGALIDLGRRGAFGFHLPATPDVVIRGFEIRWFGISAIHAVDSPRVTVQDCLAWNMHFVKGRPEGTGVYLLRCPDSTVAGSTFFCMNQGLSFFYSPHFNVHHCTFAKMQHRGARLAYTSVRGSRFISNSMTFTGNVALTLWENPEDFTQFTCDYNNFAHYIRSAAPKQSAHPVEQPKVVADPFYGMGAKGVMQLGDKRYHVWEEWQQETGKDMYSLFEHPRYLDPTRRDYRLHPTSPNIGRGENNTNIGAEPVAAAVEPPTPR